MNQIQGDFGKQVPWLLGPTAVGSAGDGKYQELMPRYNIEQMPDQNVPQQALTLGEASKIDVQQISAMLYVHMATQPTWQSVVLPVSVSNKLHHKWTITRTRYASLDPLPEGVGPRVPEKETESYGANAHRSGQGIYVHDDFFSTPEGADAFRDDLRNHAANIMGTQLQEAALAIATAHMFWNKYARYAGACFDSVRDATMSDVSNFLAFNVDPKGIYKAPDIINSWMKGASNRPRLNVGIVDENAMTKIKWGNKYHTTANLIGDGLTRANLNSTDFNLGMQIFENHPWKDVNEPGDVNPLRATATFGSYAVIDATCYGPPDIRGHREPEIEVTGLNGWDRITMREAIMNCPRWGPDGEIDAMTMEDMIDENPEFKKQFPEDKGDTFTFETDEGDVGQVSVIGHTALHYRSPQWDLYWGENAAKTFDAADTRVLNRFMSAAKNLYEVSRSDLDAFGRLDDLGAAAAQWTRDDDTGGPSARDINALFAAGEPFGAAGAGAPAGFTPAARPYGFGSIPGLLALIKVRAGTLQADFPVWQYNDLRYDEVRDVMDRVWRKIEACTGGTVVATESNTPIQFKTNSPETNKRNAVMTMILDHVKYPIYYDTTAGTGPDGTVDVSVAVTAAYRDAFRGSAVLKARAGELFDNTSKLNQALAEVAADLPTAPTNFAQLANMYGGQGRSVTKIRNMLSGVVPYLDKYMAARAKGDKDFRARKSGEYRLDMVRLDAFAAIDVAPAGRTGTSGRKMTALVFDGVVFQGGALGNFRPSYPTAPTGSIGAGSGDLREARASFPSDQPETWGAPPPTPLAPGTAAQFAHAAEQQPIFVSPQVAADPTGPFFVQIGDAYVPAPTITARFRFIKERSTNPIAACFSRALLLTPFTRQSMIRFLDCEMPLPMNIQATWAFHRMHTTPFIALETGPQLGRFYISFQKSAFTFDNEKSAWLYHYHHWSSAFIMDPAKLVILPHMMADGYISGCTTRPIVNPEDWPNANEGVGHVDKCPDVLYMDLPVDYDNQHMGTHLNPVLLTGKPQGLLSQFRYTNHASVDIEPTVAPTPSYNFYNTKFNFNSANPDASEDYDTYQEMTQTQYLPMVCLKRAYRAFGPTQKFEVVDSGSGWIDRLGPPPLLPKMKGNLEFTDKDKSFSFV